MLKPGGEGAAYGLGMTQGTPSRGSRIGRVLVRLFAGLTAAVVVVYLGVNAAAWVAARGKKADAQRQLTQALATELPLAHAHADRVRRDLGEPERSWISQECGVSTRDAGWMVQAYQTGCRLVAVAMYAVPDLPTARARVASASGETVGPAAPDPAATGCVTLTASLGDALAGVAGREQVEATFVPARGADNLWCGSYLVGFEDQARSAVTGTWSPLDPARPWLVVKREFDLGTHDVGCMRWSVLFCTAPSGLPVFGRLPASAARDLTPEPSPASS